jgi:toxin-antitoxin system PIN domain toxin
VKLVDVNVLLYASDDTSSHHGSARPWLATALQRTERLVIPWIVTVAFLRISTSQGYARPLTVEQAVSFVRPLSRAENVVAGQPDERHLDRVADLLTATGVGGNLVNDAHLAALALQYDATVISYDNDFSRFPGIRWERPLVPR